MKKLLNIAKTGARNGIYLTLLYGLFFGIYAVVRSAFTIMTSSDPSFVRNILFENTFVLIHLVLVVTLLLVPISALSGMVISLSIYWVSRSLGLINSFSKTVLTGFIVVLLIISVLHFLLSSVFEEGLSFHYWQTYLFWFVLPAIIAIADSILISSSIFSIEQKRL